MAQNIHMLRQQRTVHIKTAKVQKHSPFLGRACAICAIFDFVLKMTSRLLAGHQCTPSNPLYHST